MVTPATVGPAVHGAQRRRLRVGHPQQRRRHGREPGRLGEERLARAARRAVPRPRCRPAPRPSSATGSNVHSWWQPAIATTTARPTRRRPRASTAGWRAGVGAPAADGSRSCAPVPATVDTAPSASRTPRSAWLPRVGDDDVVADGLGDRRRQQREPERLDEPGVGTVAQAAPAADRRRARCRGRDRARRAGGARCRPRAARRRSAGPPCPGTERAGVSESHFAVVWRPEVAFLTRAGGEQRPAPQPSPYSATSSSTTAESSSPWPSPVACATTYPRGSTSTSVGHARAAKASQVTMSASSSTGWWTSCRRTAASTASGCASCGNLGECTPSTTSASPCRSSSTASSSSTRRQFTQPAVQKSSSTIRPRSCSGPTSRPSEPNQRRPRSTGARTRDLSRTARPTPQPAVVFLGHIRSGRVLPGRVRVGRNRREKCRASPFPHPAGGISKGNSSRRLRGAVSAHSSLVRRADLARRIRRKRGIARERVNVARRRVLPAPPTSRATMRERRLSPTARRRRHEAGPTWCPLVGPASPRQGAVSAARAPCRTGPARSTPARRPGRRAGSTTRSPAPPMPTSPRSGTRRSR